MAYNDPGSSSSNGSTPAPTYAERKERARLREETAKRDAAKLAVGYKEKEPDYVTTITTERPLSGFVKSIEEIEDMRRAVASLPQQQQQAYQPSTTQHDGIFGWLVPVLVYLQGMITGAALVAVFLRRWLAQ